mmetsp:Transcript_87602/g.252968  ORF Transcript_87602/g.252968 Transcript_87602/m.252968 type:complete len:256 (-) Transcript_87602:558-1325(-)
MQLPRLCGVALHAADPEAQGGGGGSRRLCGHAFALLLAMLRRALLATHLQVEEARHGRTLAHVLEDEVPLRILRRPRLRGVGSEADAHAAGRCRHPVLGIVRKLDLLRAQPLRAVAERRKGVEPRERRIRKLLEVETLLLRVQGLQHDSRALNMGEIPGSATATQEAFLLAVRCELHLHSRARSRLQHAEVPSDLVRVAEVSLLVQLGHRGVRSTTGDGGHPREHALAAAAARHGNLRRGGEARVRQGLIGEGLC